MTYTNAVDDAETVTVEGRGHVRRRQRQAHAVGQALAERAGGHLDAGRDAHLRVAGRLRVDLAELFEVVEGQIVAGQVQHRVLQRARVPVREHEAVPVGPVRLRRIVLHHLGPQDVRDGCAAHGGARVA